MLFLQNILKSFEKKNTLFLCFVNVKAESMIRWVSG